jgi:hypothetical protein
MKFQLFKRLVVEDFDQASQSMIGKISSILNPMVDQLNSGFKNNIDFHNLNQQVVTFNVTTDVNGKPTAAIHLNSNLSSAIQGIQVINAVNITDSTLLTGAPFISFTRSNGVISINQITGLPAGKGFSITAILIG